MEAIRAHAIASLHQGSFSAKATELVFATKTGYFCCKTMAKHTGSVDSSVLRYIQQMKPGNVFTPGDLSRFGSRTAVASALHRQLKTGALRSPARGIYQVPEHHPMLGDLNAPVDRIAAAVAGKHQLKLQPSGAYAANLLGLSDQVPMRIVYLTDGTPRRVRAGKQTIILRRTTPRNMATAGTMSGMVIQAIRFLGPRNVDATVIGKLRARLAPRDRARLAKDAHLAPRWVGDIMRQIAAE